MSAGPVRPRLRVLVALALVTACTLAFQVLLTRMLSSVVAYHFSFLAISLALLGTGAGALLLYVRPDRFEGAPLDSVLARWAALYALLLVTVPFALVRLNYSDVDGITLRFVLNLSAACLLAALPSFAAGVVVALAIRGYSATIGRVYAYDLVGAGIGALIIVPVLWLGDPATLIVVLGVVSGVAAVLFAGLRAPARTAGVAVTAAALAVVFASSATGILYLNPRHGLENERVAEHWTPLSRALGYEPVDVEGGDLGFVLYERVYAPVPNVGDGASLPDWKTLGLGPQSIGYAMVDPTRTLVIGGGGGRDIYNALSGGSRQVDVIELNEGIRRVVDEDLGHISGRAYSREGVNTTIGDGRSVLASRDTTYDHIHIGFTDTLSANAAQGFALTESNLYTLEAFDQYFDKLEPGGILNVSRLRKLVGEEALRTTVLTLAALEERGITDPERHIVVVRGRDIFNEEYGTVLARLEPYSDEELDRIGALADQRGDGIAFAPGGPYYEEWADLAAATSLDDFCTNYHLNVCAPTDDKPFFFNMQRLSGIGQQTEGFIYSTDPYTVLMLTLGILLVLSVIAYVLPLRVAREGVEGSIKRPTLTSLAYFGAIGVGFLLLEIALIQRFVLFLGFPTYALSVVLFALLVFTGVGSLLTMRFRDTRRSLISALAAAVALILISAYALQPALRAMIGLPFPARVLISVALLAPFGLVLGMAMPIGLRRFEALFPTGVAYAWGVNGVASVLASVLGVAVAINFGFAIATLAAGACYLAALLHAILGRWADQPPTTEAVTVPPPEEAELVGAS